LSPIRAARGCRQAGKAVKARAAIRLPPARAERNQTDWLGSGISVNARRSWTVSRPSKSRQCVRPTPRSILDLAFSRKLLFDGISVTAHPERHERRLCLMMHDYPP